MAGVAPGLDAISDTHYRTFVSHKHFIRITTDHFARKLVTRKEEKRMAVREEGQREIM